MGIAVAEFGCSLLTAGAQNPLGYWNGTGRLEVSMYKDLDLFENGDRCLSLNEVRERLTKIRDELREIMKPLRPKIGFSDASTDEEMRESIRKEIDFIRSTRDLVGG